MRNLISLIFPSLSTDNQEESAMKAAEGILYTLTTEMSIEQQTMVVKQLTSSVIDHRRNEIDNKQKELTRLKADLDILLMP